MYTVPTSIIDEDFMVAIYFLHGRPNDANKVIMCLIVFLETETRALVITPQYLFYI